MCRVIDTEKLVQSVREELSNVRDTIQRHTWVLCVDATWIRRYERDEESLRYLLYSLDEDSIVGDRSEAYLEAWVRCASGEATDRDYLILESEGSAE